VVTHAAADRQGRWFRRCMRGKPGNSGQAIWTRLVRPAPNVHFVLGGHAGYGLGWNAWLRKRTADGTLTAWWRKTGWDGGTYARHRAADGHTVHVLVANYQHLYRGGHGFMRRMRFVPDGNRVEVVTFSPHARRRLCDEDPRCADAGYVNDPRRQVLRCNNLVIRYSMTGGQRPAGSSAR
jgi:hypothetical protein